MRWPARHSRQPRRRHTRRSEIGKSDHDLAEKRRYRRDLVRSFRTAKRRRSV